jgi:hypothetical protein
MEKKLRLILFEISVEVIAEMTAVRFSATSFRAFLIGFQVGAFLA